MPNHYIGDLLHTIAPGWDRCQVSSLNERIPSIPGAALHDSLSIQKTRETATGYLTWCLANASGVNLPALT
jgi:molybdenum cofactor biosynthesis enzyme MoaA